MRNSNERSKQEIQARDPGERPHKNSLQKQVEEIEKDTEQDFDQDTEQDFD